jgi:pimeloyl-ACP methyl ester carboxylesterase
VSDQKSKTKRKPNLRPVRELTPTLQYRTIHGYRRAFRVAGTGPAILLIHGIGDNSTTWDTVQSKLAQRFTVIAPDLLGHGKSDKPRADYSVAAYANGMRDLLSVLDIEQVTVVGHSLGGGVAMQFAYQFPQLVERLILVGAGGVTKDVNIALRIASVPMGSEALALLRLPMVLPALQVIGRVGGALFGSTGVGRDLPEVVRILADLPEPTASSAFARTLRAVVDWRGQVVTMLDRCYLTESVPVQLIWGSRDSVIPVEHAKMAHSAMPGSQLEVFEGSGHFPFHDDPDRFVELVEKFIDSTEPAVYDQDVLRDLLRTGISEQTITGTIDTRVAVLDAMGQDERSATCVARPPHTSPSLRSPPTHLPRRYARPPHTFPVATLAPHPAEGTT